MDKKTTKSKRCHSCARKLQHTNGVFTSSKIDFSSGMKFCNYCKKEHPIIKEKSNTYWLVRRAKERIRYECRLYRKHLYNLRMKDPRKRLRKSVSNLIRDCIAKHGAFKGDSFPKYVNWTVDELKSHLESKFTEGMSWENYGEWHIDHIKPDSWFDYANIADKGFKESWALNNLQPLWAKDNLSKGNRYEGSKIY